MAMALLISENIHIPWENREQDDWQHREPPVVLLSVTRTSAQ